MTTPTKTKGYLLLGSPVIDLPVERVGNLLYDERGEVVHRKLNERFPNTKGITDNSQYKPGDPISFSNTPRALIRAQILREENDGEIQLLDPFQIVEYWKKLPDKVGTYADTSAVSLFPNEGPNEDLRKRVLDILGQDPTKLELPLLVLGLGVREADNDPGFTFTKTPYLKAIEAPFLAKDQRVKYDPETKTLVPAESEDEGVYIWTPNDQSGLRRARRDGGGGLGFGGGVLLSSDSDGRVPVIQDPQGRAENLDSLAAQLDEKSAQMVERATRLQKASQLLRIGKL